MNIGIIQYPGTSKETAGLTPLSNLIDIINPISDELHIILRKKTNYYSKNDGKSMLHP